jgi:hypothetical protein
MQPTNIEAAGEHERHRDRDLPADTGRTLRFALVRQSLSDRRQRQESA